MIKYQIRGWLPEILFASVLRNGKGEKMTVSEILKVVDTLKANTLDDEIKLGWINEVEGRLFYEINKSSHQDYAPIRSLSDTLSVSEPYSRMYVLYLVAMIAFSLGQYDTFSMSMGEFEKAVEEYAKYVIRNR